MPCIVCPSLNWLLPFFHAKTKRSLKFCAALLAFLLVQVVKPNVDKLMSSGVAEMLQAANPIEVVPTCPTVESILLAVPRPARLPEISREVRGVLGWGGGQQCCILV